MDDLNKLFNVATALRKRYYEEDVPNKHFKTKVLGSVINEFFIYGKFPSSFRLQFPMPVDSDTIFSALEDLFSNLSLEIQMQTNSKKWTADDMYFYATYTIKEKKT